MAPPSIFLARVAVSGAAAATATARVLPSRVILSSLSTAAARPATAACASSSLVWAAAAAARRGLATSSTTTTPLLQTAAAAAAPKPRIGAIAEAASVSATAARRTAQQQTRLQSTSATAGSGSESGSGSSGSSAGADGKTWYRRLWDSPVGIKTVHFWAPVMKWMLVFAGLADMTRPADKLSVTQNVALMTTGLIWTRWCFVITPKNYLLAAANFFLGLAGFVQCVRIYVAQSGKKEA